LARATFGYSRAVAIDRWFLTPAERGNDASRIDAGHPDGTAWSTGNEVGPPMHGAPYFAELLKAVNGAQQGDVVMFTDWRGDPDERLDGPDTEVADVLGAAAERGVYVKGLVWRSHWDRLQFSEEENRHLGEQINARGGEVLRDMRVRVGGSHHQKFVVVRHRHTPELDVAFVGGVDLCHGRRDDAEHHGDEQAGSMPEQYGSRPAWHDAQVAVRGPAVADVETVFRERWEDPAPLTRNPIHRVHDALSREDTSPSILPEQLPPPPERGRHAVQLLRTYPNRGRLGYPFAPRGERSIARAYAKVLGNARHLVYIEDQYLWSPEVARPFAEALRREPELRVIVVVPRFPDQEGRFTAPPQEVGRNGALSLLHRVGGDRLAVYGIENDEGTPVYVHAKVCVVDDVWAAVGSDNLSMRSWTYDTELSCAVVDEASLEAAEAGVDGLPDGYAQRQRLLLAREHLGRADGDDADLRDPKGVFDAFAASADELDAWYEGGRQGPRPAGRLRRYRPPKVGWLTRLWATGVYRTLYDPDGRPRDLRRRREF
jgi:phosphatidylserine/phosphatidylglycerophosphate/cardiolipin synthase-like enzyme